jgi:hypothetical protein
VPLPEVPEPLVPEPPALVPPPPVPAEVPPLPPLAVPAALVPAVLVPPAPALLLPPFVLPAALVPAELLPALLVPALLCPARPPLPLTPVAPPLSGIPALPAYSTSTPVCCEVAQAEMPLARATLTRAKSVKGRVAEDMMRRAGGGLMLEARISIPIGAQPSSAHGDLHAHALTHMASNMCRATRYSEGSVSSGAAAMFRCLVFGSSDTFKRN